MLTYRPAAPEQYDDFLQLLVAESRDYLDTTLHLMGADWDRFAQLFHTVGQVCSIYSEDGCAGFYWVEVRDAVLHLHGLILRPEFQGKGIGRQVLADLEAQYQGRVEAIELGAHRSNQRALALYQRAGFQTVKTLEELGFLILQKKPIGPAERVSVLNRIATSQGRRDEAPNRELARDLVEQGDHDGIRELVANLRHPDQNIRSDCLKTLYEVGNLQPELITDYVDEFLGLLRDRNNRMIWGSMLALSTIAPLRADELFEHRAEIQAVMAEGSVITVDNGVKILATVAAANASYRSELLPFLLHHLETCRPKDVPQHAEAILQAVDGAYADAFVAVLERRMAIMSASQATRLRRVIAKSCQFGREARGLKTT